MTITKNYATLTVEQLRQLLSSIENDSQEIRVWVESKNQDGNIYLQGRVLCGVINDPNDDYVSLIAGFEKD